MSSSSLRGQAASAAARSGAWRRNQRCLPQEARAGGGDVGRGSDEDNDSEGAEAEEAAEAGRAEAEENLPGPSGESGGAGGEGDETCRRLIRQQYRELISTVQRKWPQSKAELRGLQRFRSLVLLSARAPPPLLDLFKLL